jgi:hypothetical protein
MPPRIQRKGRGSGGADSNSIPSTPERGIEIPDRETSRERDEAEGRGEGGRGTKRKRGAQETNETNGQETTKLVTQSSVPKISTKLVLSQRAATSVQKEDLDEQTLSYEDIADFVSVSFGDQTDGLVDLSKINWEYSAERRGETPDSLSLSLSLSLDGSEQVVIFYLLKIQRLVF